MVSRAYSVARRAFDSAETALARMLYLRCLDFDPDCAEAHHDLGVLAALNGEDSEAMRRFERCLALDPAHPEAWQNFSTVLCRNGRLADAARAAEAGVAARPNAAAAHLALGMAREASGDLDGAARSFAVASDLDPASPDGSLKGANVLRRLGRLAAAADSADLCVARDPNHYGARIIRGMIRDGLGLRDDADEDFASAMRLCPKSSEAFNVLGVICLDQGRLDHAVAALAEAARLGPARAEPCGNLGLALQRQGRVREAFAAYAQAVTIEPTHAVAQCNLAGLLIELGEYEAANSAASLAAQADPHRAEAEVCRGIALRRLGRSVEALAAFRRAVSIRPDSGEALVELCDIRQQACDWQGLGADLDAALAATVSAGKRVPPFQVLTLTGSPELQRDAARLWAAAFRARAVPLPARTIRPAGRLRVGYLSADFRTHATAMLVVELLERHDRSRFEIFGYSCGEDDASPMRRRIVASLDHFVDVRGLSHLDAAKRIRGDGIDILIDLKGYTREARPEILAHRPAPIQVNYLGYPGTLGAGLVDYIIADAVVAPFDHAAQFDEAIVHLPHSYQPNDGFRTTAGRRPTRRDYGLPDTAFVFCCLNNSYKITPEVFDAWGRLLRQTAGSVLWLFEGDGSAVLNLRREAESRGLEPHRLVFAPKVAPDDHLSRLALADLFLDTLPVNAHTTASEALWAGLPVVTLMGEAFVSRVAASLLGAVGLPDLVTTSLRDYEALALRLARDPERLARLRAHLAEARHTAPLFDTPRYTRNFEAALLRMADLQAAGHPPQAFAVAEPVA